LDEETPAELDLHQLEIDLYDAWEAIRHGNYLTGSLKVGESYLAVCKFNQSLDDRHLPATTDRGPRALVTKFLYAVRNRINRLPGGKTWRCWQQGYSCEWVYPYGWVPEAGCPEHD